MLAAAGIDEGGAGAIIGQRKRNSVDLNTILIVEDDVDVAEMLRRYFTGQGYEVILTHFGEEAVEKAVARPPDLALLDIRLPDINGFEVCRRLRENRHTANLPVIFLTERREREARLAGLELGAVDYITKPFDDTELRLRVRNALRRSQLEPMVNPITGLPEGPVVKGRLEAALQQPDWGLVVADVRGLEGFRDRYGFVAADDAARAISLLIKNAMQEQNLDEAFIGHLDGAEFIVVTTAARCRALAESCRERLDAGLQYFYPATERDTILRQPSVERLHVRTTFLNAGDNAVEDLDALQGLLQTMA